MNLNAEAAVNHFAKHRQLADLVLIYGAEPLLNIEALEAWRDRGKRDGYTERQRIDLSNDNDWRQILIEIDSPSLFAPKRLLELHNDGKKPSKIASDTLQAIAAKPLTNLKIALFAPHFDKIDKLAWYKKTFAGEALAIRSFNLFPSAFNKQIQQRLQQAQLALQPDALTRFLSYSQGNLIAAQQAIERLKIHPAGQQPISATTLDDLLTDLSQFSAFALSDAILQAKWQQAYTIAVRLAQEGNDENILITWLLQRDMSLLLQLLNSPAAQHPSIYKTFKIHGRYQQRNYQSAQQHHNYTSARALLKLSAHLDSITKGAQHGDYWLSLRQYLLLYIEH